MRPAKLIVKVKAFRIQNLYGSERFDPLELNRHLIFVNQGLNAKYGFRLKATKAFWLNFGREC